MTGPVFESKNYGLESTGGIIFGFDEFKAALETIELINGAVLDKLFGNVHTPPVWTWDWVQRVSRWEFQSESPVAPVYWFGWSYRNKVQIEKLAIDERWLWLERNNTLIMSQLTD